MDSTTFYLTHPYNKRTVDWKISQLRSIINISIKQKDLPNIHMNTETGIIGKIGCNSHGIGICLNALTTDILEPKVPIDLGLRSILEPFDIDESLLKIRNNLMASAAHFFVCSAESEGATVGISPRYTAINKIRQGYLTHTNHICSPKLKEISL